MLSIAKSVVRASRLTYRKQLLAPTNLPGVISSFRKYLKQPPRVMEIGARLAAENKWDELDELARTTDLLFLEGNRPLYLHDLSHIERRIILETSAFSAQSVESLVQLCRAVEYVIKAGIRGDFVECGVYRGASILTMIRMLQHLGETRNI